MNRTRTHQGIHRSNLLWVTALALLGHQGASASSSVPRGLGLRAELRLGSLFNSNPFQYSREDRSAFVHRDPASRFGIRSVDDTALRGGGLLALSYRVLGAGLTRMSYEYSWNSFARNPVRNGHTTNVSLRQPLPRQSWVELRYARTPPSYLRHLWDVDFRAPYESYPHYQPAYISNREIEARSGHRLGRRWALSGGVARSRQDYNSAFTERGARSWEETAELSWGTEDGPTLAFSPSYLRKTAKGTDPGHPEIPDSLRSDTSSSEWELALRGSLPEGSLRGMPLEVRARASWLERSYSTSRTTDVTHHGRTDRAAGVSLGLERSVMHNLSIYAVTRYEAQWTRGIAAVGSLGEVASWRQFVAGGGIHAVWSGRMPW